MNRFTTTLLLILTLFLTTSCAIRPETKRPELKLPERGTKGKTSRIDTSWWRGFRDETLNSLIEEAVKNSDDLKLATARMEEAMAALGLARSELYPEITGSGSATRVKTSDEMSPTGKGPTTNTFSLSGMVSYEVDLWGRLKNQREAALHRLLSSKAQRDALRISLISEVAGTYFNLIALQEKINTTEEILARYRDIYEFRLKQFKHGLIDELVPEQAKAEYEAARVLLENLKKQRETLKSSLSLLLGREPKEIFEPAFDLKEGLPEPIPIPAFVPSELLNRRPDIVEAEEALRAAEIDIAVTKANYFPRISLTGALGLQSRELGSLIQSSASFWNIAGALTGPIFDFGRTKQSVRIKEAQMRQALIQYIKTVKTAFSEVYEALQKIERTRAGLKAQEAQMESLERVLRIATTKYDRGLTDYLTVLDAQRGYLNAKLNLISLKAELLHDHILLYKALGGGWSKMDNNNRKDPRAL